MKVTAVPFYEGHWDWENVVNGKPIWVRDHWVASVDIHYWHEAASVCIDNSSDGLDFGLSSYYCTIDWEPLLSDPKHGYFYAGMWAYTPWVRPNVNGHVYLGDVGTPRFHYRDVCPVDIP